jgi:hypothetical protein
MRKLSVAITPETAANIVEGVVGVAKPASAELAAVTKLTGNVMETSRGVPKAVSKTPPPQVTPMTEGHIRSKPIGQTTGPRAGEMRHPKVAALLAPLMKRSLGRAPSIPYPEIPGAIKAIANSTKLATFVGDIIPKAAKGLAETLTHGVTAPTNKAMKLLGNNPKGTSLVSTPIHMAEDFKSIRAKLDASKTAGVVDRTVAEIQDLQHGYRFMRNPYAEAAASNRSREFINYFKGASLKGGLAEKAGKTEKDFDPKSIKAGAEVESEHTSNMALRKEIAMDHLTEDPHYYEKLKKMEKKSMRINFRIPKPLLKNVPKAGGENGVFWKIIHDPLTGKLSYEIKGAGSKMNKDDILIKSRRLPGAGFSKGGTLEKTSFIRHEGGKYVVYSHSGKHMGTYNSEGEAKHRLQQIEYFKKQGTYTKKERAVSAATFGGSTIIGNKLYDALSHTKTKTPVMVGGTILAAGLGALSPIKFQKQGMVDKNLVLTDLFTPGRAKGPGPELWKEDPRVDVLSKGASLEMDIYKRNRKTLLS